MCALICTRSFSTVISQLKGVEQNRLGCILRNPGLDVVARARSLRDVQSASEGGTDLHNQCKMTRMVDLWGTQSKMNALSLLFFKILRKTYAKFSAIW